MIKLPNTVCPKDHLMARPPEPLPTRLDPNSPEARLWSVDPKPIPRKGQGDPDETNPRPQDIARSA